MEYDNRKRKALILLFLILSLTVYTAYATTIFSDGFETGDFSAWTGTLGSPTIVSTPTHHGTYSMQISTSGTQGAYETISATNPVWMRLYVRFASISLTSGQYDELIVLRNTNNWGPRIELYHNSIDYYFSLYDGYWGSRVVSDIKPALNTWYCLELKNDNGGNCQFWIDGVSKGITAAMPSSAPAVITCYASRTQPYTFDTYYLDCVVVSDTYIGVEVSGQDLTFQLSQTITPTSTLYEGKEKGFSLSEIVALTSSLVQQKELSFPLSVTVKATSTLTMNKEIAIVIHEWFYSLQETAHLTSNLYITLEVAEKVSLGLGFYIGVLALVIALMAYLRSRH